MLLQATADQFGVQVDEYADIAFRRGSPQVRLRLRGVPATRHRRLPAAGMEAGRDHAPGSRRCCRRTSGYTSRRFPSIAALGTNFVLQGGTQHNLAAVKAQVDYIESRVPDAAERHRPRALRRIGRDRRGHRSRCALGERGASDVHRPRRGVERISYTRTATRTRGVTSARTNAAHLHRREGSPADGRAQEPAAQRRASDPAGRQAS